jgi:hypothetical protein
METGRLVKRVAPALERKRAAAKVTSATKAKRSRATAARERLRKQDAETARFTLEGVDLRVEMKRLAKLRAFGGTLLRQPLELELSRRRREPMMNLGCQALTCSSKIILATYPGQTLADAREALVHELAHIFVDGLENVERELRGEPRRVGKQRSGHTEAFRIVMTAAFKEAYKVNPVFQSHGGHGAYARALRRKEMLAERAS